MSRILEAVFALFITIVAPVQLYILGVGGFIFTVFILEFIRNITYSKQWLTEDMFYEMIKKIAVYTPAVVFLYWLDEFNLNQLTLKYIDLDHIFTRISCGIIVFREIFIINRLWKELFGTSLSENLDDLWKFVKNVKKKYKGWKK